jgi:DNA-directed RNA polymerase specialized sigma24 family protein
MSVNRSWPASSFARLIKLLVSMARNKVADQIRREHAECRDTRRLEPGDVRDREVIGSTPSPSRVVSGRDLLEAFRQRMTPEERRVADLRSQGCEWPEIATVVGGQPDNLRKKMDRTINRIARELGLDDLSHA